MSKLDKLYVDLTPLSNTKLITLSEFWSEQQIFKGPGGGNLWGIQGKSKRFLKPQISTFSELWNLTVDFALFDTTNLMVHSNFPFDHFIFQPLFKVECRCQRSTCEQSFPWNSLPQDWWYGQLQQFDILFFRWPQGVRYMQCIHVLLFAMRCIVLHRSLFDVWCGILFSYMCHGSCLMWWGIICKMYLLSWFIMFCLRSLYCHVDGILMCRHVCLHWDPFYAILAGCSLSSCMSLCHIDRSPFLTEFL